MKSILWGTAVCALMLAACNKKPGTETGASDAQGGQRPLTAAAPLPHPDEMESPFAPSGVFFLLERTSLETDSGVLNYSPGSKVIKSGNRYITSDGKQLTLKAEQVTNDLRIATRVAGNNPKVLAGIQASIRNTLATPNYMPPPPREEARIHARPNPEPRK